MTPNKALAIIALLWATSASIAIAIHADPMLVDAAALVAIAFGSIHWPED